MTEIVISSPTLPHHIMPRRVPAQSPSFAPPMTSFIGRERELDQIDGLLGNPDVRLVTLTGPGGVGKTRLALEAGRRQARTRFPDHWCVTLMGWTTPDDVIPAIAHAVGVREYGDRPIAAVLATALGDRRGLIILDNAEHVLAAAADLANLLQACPGLTLLVTSREPLRLSGEHEIRLEPLPVADPALNPAPFSTLAAESTAVRLFVSRAVSAHAGFTVTEGNFQPIRQLCHMLDGLPLAIELAAARVTMLSPAALLTRFAQREHGPLPYLTDGPRDLPDRQRTLRDTIRWSYDLLTPPEQAAFRAVSAFECSFGLDQAEVVIASALLDHASAPLPFPLLAALVAKSLVVAYPDTSPPRFNLLATIRDFGREQLDDSADAPRLRQLHAELVRDQTAAWEAALEGPAYAEVLAQFTAELGNVTTALEHVASAGEDDLLLALAGNLADLWRLRGLHGDGMHWLSLALARVPSGHSPARIRALIGAGSLGMMRCDYPGGRDFFQAAVAGAELACDTRLIARALFHLAEAHDAGGDTPLAEALLDRAEVIAAGRDPSLAIVIARAHGEFARRRGDVALAVLALERALTLSREVGYQWAEADVRLVLAAVARDQGDALRARDHLMAAVAIFDHVDDPVGIANVGTALAWLAPERGEPAAGLRLYAASSHLYASLGLREPRHKYPAHADWLSGLHSSLGPVAAREWEAGWALRQSDLVQEISSLADRFSIGTRPASGLTEREAEVLGLVASGLSNAAIAERLFLSPRTINAHLTRIYGKIAAPNRHAAIRFAIDHGLANAPADMGAPAIK